MDSECPAPCRHCGGPTWMRDEEGAVHPCCQLHGIPCLACEASESLNREHKRRQLTRKIKPSKLVDEGNVSLPIDQES